MGIEFYNEYEICQICKNNLENDDESKIDGPILRIIFLIDDVSENCKHYFHVECIKKEFYDYIINGFPFQLHCFHCGYLKEYSKICFWELTLYKMLNNRFEELEYDDVDDYE